MISCDLQAVVASSDASVLDLLPAWLKSIGIQPIVYGQAAPALQTVRKQRIDAVFMDWDLDRDFSVLRELRNATQGRKLIGMALVSPETPIREAYRFSDFVLDKPLVQQRVMQTLRAAHGMMVQDRMQYTRLPLGTEARIVNAGERSFAAVATNVSQTGIALQSTAQFASGEIVQIHFHVPEVAKALACRAKVIWTDGRNKAGLSFLEMNPCDRQLLSSWIESQFIEGWQQKVPHAALMPAASQASVTAVRTA
jgi:hypothetical protein